MELPEKLPHDLPPDSNVTTNGTDESRGPTCRRCGEVHGLCKGHLVNGKPCPAGPMPDNPGKCANNHFLIENTAHGSADRRVLAAHRAEVAASLVEHLEEWGWTRENAPVSARTLCRMAAEFAVLLDHRTGNAEKCNRLATSYTNALRALDSLSPRITPNGEISDNVVETLTETQLV